MRHAKLVPAVMAMGMLFLSGCTLSVYNSYRDIENLDVVQVIGLDAVDGGGSQVLSRYRPRRIRAGARALDAGFTFA